MSEITLSVLKADIGSIGGHISPSQKLLEAVENAVCEYGEDLLIDHYISCTGDDVAILCTHERGEDDEKIHKLAWDAFLEGTEVAKEQGLYGAGQDLLKDSFSGNVKGMGPAVAEIEFEERPNEPFILFAADKTEPGAYNLPLYLSFSDPMFNAGLMLSPRMKDGFVFTIMDVEHTEGDRIIKLKSPEDIYDIAALLRDNQKFVVESIETADGEPVVAVSTTRLHNIAGEYTGKDDPVMLARCQKKFPATGELLQPYKIGHYVSGFMRGSHNGPLMPCRLNSTISFFDGPPVVTAAAFCVQDGILTEPEDAFDHPFWDHIREKVSNKAEGIREQGFSGNAMLDYSELEYGGIVEKMEELEEEFTVRD